ncbi:MAG: glycosyltransferase family 2 protein [Deltaproteobacteria bacterium]|nr:glycosyltransferase family 2 protein [Deltaproteobacteria bacterium]
MGQDEFLAVKREAPSLKDVVVVIPAFNEEKVIASTVARALAVSREWGILVIDDGSDDRTAEEALQAGAQVISHSYNMGNGSAVKTALRRVTAPVMAILDADGQLPPEALPEMVKRLVHADMVVGARVNQTEVSRFRSFGNWVLRRVSSYVSGHPIPDLTCGLRVFFRERCQEFFHLYPSRFSFPSTSTLAFLTCDYRVEFYPIEARPRPVGTKSKIKPWQDGLQFLAIILRIVLLFRPYRIFVPGSFCFFLAGLGHQIFTLFLPLNHGRLVMSGTFITMSLSALFLFCFGLLAQQIAELRIHLSQISRNKE